MKPNIKTLFSKIDKWKKDGVTSGRLIAEFNKWKKQYSFSKNEKAEIIQKMEI